jgi:hypothetical protein
MCTLLTLMVAGFGTGTGGGAGFSAGVIGTGTNTEPLAGWIGTGTNTGPLAGWIGAVTGFSAGVFGTGTSPVCGAGAFGTGTNTEFAVPGGAATGNSTDCCAGTGCGAGGLWTVAVVCAPAMLVLAVVNCGAGADTYIM